MPVRFMAKKERGCGTRKVGGLYLFFNFENTTSCPNLPLPIPDACPCCGEGITQARGLKYVTPSKLLPVITKKCETPGCPVCNPPESKAGLLWVGNMFYSTKQFLDEAIAMGISKRVATVPISLKPGDWVYFAHPAAIRVGSAVFDEAEAPRKAKNTHTEPGIFLVAKLTEIQKIIKEEDAKDEQLIRSLELIGVTPVVEHDEKNIPMEIHLAITEHTSKEDRGKLPSRATCTRCDTPYGYGPKGCKNPQYCPKCLTFIHERENNAQDKPRTKRKTK